MLTLIIPRYVQWVMVPVFVNAGNDELLQAAVCSQKSHQQEER